MSCDSGGLGRFRQAPALLHKCVHITVLASDPYTRLLDGYKVKMTGKNCLNYTIKEEMYRQLCKNWGKTIQFTHVDTAYAAISTVKCMYHHAAISRIRVNEK